MPWIKKHGRKIPVQKRKREIKEKNGTLLLYKDNKIKKLTEEDLKELLDDVEKDLYTSSSGGE